MHASENANQPTASKDFAPEISKLAKKRSVSMLPTIAIGAVLIIFLIGFAYIFFFKGKGEKSISNANNNKVKAEIIKKEFSFSKPAEPEQIKEFASKDTTINHDNDDLTSITNTKNSLIPKHSKSKAVFKKYRSIPLKAESTNVSTNAAAADHKEAQKDGEPAVIAEKIKIDPNFLLAEGTYIPCSLMTKFSSDIAGRVTCTISQDVHSANGSVKLIEKGTKAIGNYQNGTLKHGVGRMFVIWTKLITPDFKRIKLVDTQVVGQLGESGIAGRIDSHFFQRFGGALLVSTAKDLLKAGTQRQKKGDKTEININTMESTKDTFEMIVEKMLENSINIAPTMYKDQGDIVGILVGRDIDFSKIYRLKIRE